jgi:phosphoglycerol transferase MdoB-like AlkP superfamily enzyme
VLLFFKNFSWLQNANRIFSFCLLLVLLLLTLANTLLYKEWQSLISKRALGFLLFPKQIIASLSLGYVVLTFLFVAVLQIVFFKFWIKKVGFLDAKETGSKWVKIAAVLLIPPLLFIGARGGLQLIPINESAVYFSNQTVLNHVAVNPIWYLGSSILNPVEEDSKFQFMEEKDALQFCSNLYKENKDSSKHVLTTTRPNIVFLVLESHTADVLATLGGEKNVCPNLDSLAENGILFTDIYASGMRTDQGLLSILSAFPPQPDKSMIKYTSKVEKLPSLYRTFNSINYSSSFYYGGEVGFANIGAYLKQTGATKIVEKQNFLPEQLNSKWGAHDEFVFTRQLNELKNEKQPFFSVLLSLSNHEPFETPTKSKFFGKDESNRFRSTAAYTDSCIGVFFAEAAKQKWYANTLFVIVADHGHRLPQNNDLNAAKAKHIPLIFAGEVIKNEWKRKKVRKIGTQQDIAKTILIQLELDAIEYEWSKDLLNTSSEDFAFYTNENVLGWISKNDTLIYSFVEQKNIGNKSYHPRNEQTAKAYLQAVYNKFIRY